MPRPERLFYRGSHGKPQSVWNTLDAKPLRPALVPSGLVLYTDGQNLHTGERGHCARHSGAPRLPISKYLLAYH